MLIRRIGGVELEVWGEQCVRRGKREREEYGRGVWWKDAGGIFEGKRRAAWLQRGLGNDQWSWSVYDLEPRRWILLQSSVSCTAEPDALLCSTVQVVVFDLSCRLLAFTILVSAPDVMASNGEQ